MPATRYWAVLDRGKELARITSEDELEFVLRSVPQSATFPNAIVNLSSPSGDTLSIGMSGGLACLNFMDSTGDPPYLTAVGNAALSPEDGVQVFRYEGQWTEIPTRNCVPLDTAIRVAREFYRTGELPDFLEWEEV